MRACPPIIACCCALVLASALALGPCAVRAQVPAALAGMAPGMGQEGEWVSYRDVYRTMVQFEKYGGPKNLLQSQVQVRTRERGGPGDGVQLALAGKNAQLNLPLDPLGRTVFPLQKAAYEENAAVVLSRKGVPFALRRQVTIVPRADGQYDGAELRAACAQALGFARYVDASQRTRQCAGVRFVFANKAHAGARLRLADGSEQALPVVPGPAFADDADDGFPTITYRFAGAERAQVATFDAPLAIVPLFD